MDNIMKPRIFGFVFARGGSKGVVGKNIRQLGGEPLIAHTIKCALASGILDRLIVSTEDKQIAAIAHEFGAEVPFFRPAELASDHASEWLAWRHAIEQVEPFDVFVSLPATSPLRAPQDIVSCVKLYLEGDSDMVVTVRHATRHPSFNMVKQDKERYLHLVMPPEEAIVRRQDVPPVFDMTTVAYVSNPGFIRGATSVFQGRVRAVTIPDERALDIDTELDFAFAEFMLSGVGGKRSLV